MQSNGFKHIGKIISIEQDGDATSKGVIYVAIDPISACEGCRAKHQCISMSSIAKDSKGGKGGKDDDDRRVIKVEYDDVSRFEVGNTVDVSVTYRIGIIAIMVSFVIPLILLISMLATLIVGFDIEQGVAAAATFVTLGIYYGFVYALRQYFERIVEFGITRI